MKASVTPVTFLNKDGQRLFGIFHEPAQRRVSDTAILLLSPGVKMRVAPHRLYNKMTARFVELGYPVFRFDFHALGDSEGEAPEPMLADFYGATQVGRYIADTISAMDWLQEAGITRFIASGLCGGALTGMLTAARDTRIVSLMGLSIPVILDGTNVDSTKYMTDTQLKGTRSRYFSKFRLWDPQVWRSWMRLFTFQSHYSLIVRSMIKPLFTRVTGPVPTAAGAPTDNTNPHFAPGFRAMVESRRPVFLVFAESDRLLPEFEVKFAGRHRDLIESPHYEQHVTAQANHIFSFSEWQHDVLERCCDWLERRQGAAVEGRAAGSPASNTLVSTLN